VNAACAVTASDVLGPYYQAGAPSKRGEICASNPAYDRLRLTGQVQKQDCASPLPATMDLWQADEAGVYSPGGTDFSCRSVITTDENGFYSFLTRMPGRYDDDGYRPAHIHLKIVPRDTKYAPLVTQVYFVNDAYLGKNDSCGVCHSGDPTLQALVIHRADIKTYEGNWNIVLKPRAAGEESMMQQKFQQQAAGRKQSYTEVQPHIQPASRETDRQELVAEISRLRAQLNGGINNVLF